MQKNTATALNLLAIVFGMALLAYASVPLYRIFCQVTGYGGTTNRADIIPTQIYDREITVRFNADVMPNLPWRFEAAQAAIKVKIGKPELAFFIAENISNQPTIGTSTFNVLPHQAGQYFVKVQCFCFEKQPLAAGEIVNMPVSFYIDPAIMNDKELADLTAITLSYSFFPAKK